MKDILFLIESKNGHDESLVPQAQLPEKVNEQIADGKWATLEKENGSTEILTKEVKKDEWKDVFKDTKSVTTTSKMKGG